MRNHERMIARYTQWRDPLSDGVHTRSAWFVKIRLQISAPSLIAAQHHCFDHLCPVLEQNAEDDGILLDMISVDTGENRFDLESAGSSSSNCELTLPDVWPVDMSVSFLIDHNQSSDVWIKGILKSLPSDTFRSVEVNVIQSRLSG